MLVRARVCVCVVGMTQVGRIVQYMRGVREKYLKRSRFFNTKHMILVLELSLKAGLQFKVSGEDESIVQSSSSFNWHREASRVQINQTIIWT